VRLIGGLDWWRYGVERLAAVARTRGIALAVLPGEDRDDPRLAEASTLPVEELAALLRYFREGGLENLRALLGRLARHCGEHSGGERSEVREPQPLPRCAGYLPGVGAVDLDRLAARLPAGKPVVPVIFYRALLLAADTAAIDDLCAALEARGLAPAPLVITSLKEPAAADFVGVALARLAPAAIVTTTAFASGGPGEATPLDGSGVRRAGVPGSARDDKTQRVAERCARPRCRRSRDARRASRARRARARRRGVLQGCVARGGGPFLHRFCQSLGAGPYCRGRRPHRGAGAPCRDAA
jgi:cobaltochelatase CobN